MSRLLEALEEEIADLEGQLANLRDIRQQLSGQVSRKQARGRRQATEKEGGNRRPPSKGKRGGTAQRVAEYFASHPKCSNAEAAKALGLQEPAAGYHLAKLRKAAR